MSKRDKPAMKVVEELEQLAAKLRLGEVIETTVVQRCTCYAEADEDGRHGAMGCPHCKGKGFIRFKGTVGPRVGYQPCST